MEIIIQQAITAHQEGKFEEAEQLYRSILENQPTNFIVRNNLGVLQFNLGRFNEAEANYRKAIELKPDYADACSNLGNTLKELARFDEAEVSYRKAIELKPDYVEAHYNLGVILQELNRFDDAAANYKKAIELKPSYVEAHNNLGNALKELARFDEAAANYRKAIELKPDYVEAHYNLGVILYELDRFDEAEESLKKVIELKPDYVGAYYNLGIILYELSKLDEAEANYRKAIELKPDYTLAHSNLDDLLNKKNLLDHIFEKKKSIKKNKVNSDDTSVGLTSNPFIAHRNVETKLLKDIYKSELIEFDKTIDARYGNGTCSDFNVFKNDSLIVKNLQADLINIMKKAVKSDIYIYDSFLNIFQAGSGSAPHDHIGIFDKKKGLMNQKYSLTYYLSVGDQNCIQPGNLQLYDPSEEIKLSEGTIVIIPATRQHGSIYSGKTDRIMIGVNFYSLL